MKQKKRFARALSDVRNKLPPINRRQFLIQAIPFLFIFYLGDKLAWLYQYCQGETALVRLINLLSNVQLAFQGPLFSFMGAHILCGLVLASALVFLIRYRKQNAKKYRQGMEYGSARWSA